MQIVSPRRLRTAIDYNDLSVRKLAAKAGVHRSVIGHLLTGERDTTTPESAKAIESALHLPPGMLFEFKASAVRRAA